MRIREILAEAKPKKQAVNKPEENTALPLEVLICPLFIESFRNRKGIAGVKDSLIQFVLAKTQNPLQKVGKDDKPFVGVIPANHAKLTSDVSIVYTLSGSNPRQLKLFGVFTHDDIGTGQPSNARRMASFADRLKNQTEFNPFSPSALSDKDK